ncbi:hypothetical protein [Rubinisphaera italica]|uniref:hypothetical protein n=1 Tax=Rubinisphaera italica TaxID=2527969 RepID=UPI0013EF1A77|nr:hypothetical protein [Rubinisphaera italica]
MVGGPVYLVGSAEGVYRLTLTSAAFNMRLVLFTILGQIDYDHQKAEISLKLTEKTLKRLRNRANRSLSFAGTAVIDMNSLNQS